MEVADATSLVTVLTAERATAAALCRADLVPSDAGEVAAEAGTLVLGATVGVVVAADSVATGPAGCPTAPAPDAVQPVDISKAPTAAASAMSGPARKRALVAFMP